MKKQRKESWRIQGILTFFILLCAITLSACVGSVDLSVSDSIKILMSRLPVFEELIDISDIRQVYINIIWNVRLPRILLSALVGGSLALTGAVFQGVFRNPLADSHVLGISSGAAMGATIAILTGIQSSFFGMGITGCFAFVGAVLTIYLVYRVAGTGNSLPVVSLLLTGTAISAMLSALIALLMALNRSGIERVYMWTLGSFSSASWTKTGYLFVFLLFCGIILYSYAKDFNLLTTGYDSAESLGVDLARLKKTCIIMASLLVAASVSVSGIIGFVGLIIPHCIRLLGGFDYRRLLPFSLFLGAIFMIACDTIARTVIAPSEIPVGVVTAIVGAPYFIFLIGKNRG